MRALAMEAEIKSEISDHVKHKSSTRTRFTYPLIRSDPIWKFDWKTGRTGTPEVTVGNILALAYRSSPQTYTPRGPHTHRLLREMARADLEAGGLAVAAPPHRSPHRRISGGDDAAAFDDDGKPKRTGKKEKTQIQTLSLFYFYLVFAANQSHRLHAHMHH